MEAEGGSSQELFKRLGIGVLVAAIQTVEGHLHGEKGKRMRRVRVNEELLDAI